MTLPTAITPIMIIEKASKATEPYLLEEFMRLIGKIYQYEIFKPFMDLVATLAAQGRLKFVIEPKQFYHLDHGHCITIDGSILDKVTNSLRRVKNYKISIKKLSSDIIIHEIGHMVERECNLNLTDSFKQATSKDLNTKYSKNVSLNSAIESIMISELQGYPKDEQASELFTRFFQIMSLSKEVSGFASPYGYSINDVYKAFPNLSTWMSDSLFSHISKHIDADIVNMSQGYIVSAQAVEHKWSEEKVSSFHKGTASSKKQWTNTIKPINDI